jgi:hypothetical protein
MGPNLTSVFYENVRKVFAIRCPSCDEDFTFFPDAKSKKVDSQSFLETLPPKLRDALSAFDNYRVVSASFLVDETLKAFGPEKARGLLCPPEFLSIYEDEADVDTPVILLDVLGPVERQGNFFFFFIDPKEL